MNADIENTMKQCATSLDYQQMQTHEKTILYDLPWEVVGADIFSINNNTLLCIVDCYKFPIVKRAGALSADNLIRVDKIVFTEFWLPKKIVSDLGMNFILDQFK